MFKSDTYHSQGHGASHMRQIVAYNLSLLVAKLYTNSNMLLICNTTYLYLLCHFLFSYFFLIFFNLKNLIAKTIVLLLPVSRLPIEDTFTILSPRAGINIWCRVQGTA